jgi:hypothetical protein
VEVSPPKKRLAQDSNESNPIFNMPKPSTSATASTSTSTSISEVISYAAAVRSSTSQTTNSLPEKKEEKERTFFERKPRLKTAFSKHPVIIKPQGGTISFGKLGPWRQAQILKNSVGPITDLHQISNGEWLVGCISKEQQRKLLSFTSLPGEPKKPIQISTRVPKTLVIGVIKGVPFEEHAEKLIKTDLESQDFQIEHIQRLKNKDGSPSNAMKVTFLENVLPDTVKLGYSLHRVIAYVPPIRRCTNCQLLGHVKQECRRKTPRCARCSKNHITAECTSETRYCVNCCGSHSAADLSCSEYSVRRLAHEIKNKNFTPFTEALTLARSKWNSEQKYIKQNNRDFIPQKSSTVTSKPTTKTTIVAPKEADIPSKTDQKETKEKEKNIDSPPSPSPSTSTSPNESSQKRKKAKKGSRFNKTQQQQKKSKPVQQENRSKPVSQEQKTSNVSNIEHSVKMLSETIKNLQTEIRETNPQAARLLDGIFVILQTIYEIAQHGV